MVRFRVQVTHGKPVRLKNVTVDKTVPVAPARPFARKLGTFCAVKTPSVVIGSIPKSISGSGYDLFGAVVDGLLHGLPFSVLKK
jgi:hypothetical protein